jgi:hypothetical protein
VSICVPIGSAGRSKVTCTPKTGRNPLRTNGRPSSRLRDPGCH